MKIFKFVKEYIFKYKIQLFIFLIFSIISWIISIGLPYITGNYIDSLMNFQNRQTIIDFTIKILLMGIINIISSFVVSYSYVKVQTKSAIELNFKALEHISKMPILYFKNLDSAYLNQRINSDSNTLISFVLSNFLDILIRALTLIIVFYISFKINRKLTMILIPLIPLYLAIYFIFKKPLFKSGYELKEKQNKFFSKMNEQLYNINLIKLNSTFEESQKQLRTSFSTMFESLLKYTRISYIFSSSDSMTMIISQIIIFFFGGMEIINENLTIGQFTIIISYFSMIMGCISYYLNLGKSYQDALVSYNRLEEILNETKEINGDKRINSIDTIVLKEVCFSYDDTNNIIDNFNYTFKKGNIYGIIGQNGTGKSTFINLILGLFNNYYKGKIYYNSIELKKLDMYHIRKRIIGISEQEPALINDTIGKNVTYGIDIYNYDDIEEVLKSLNLDINKFQDGLNTNIYEAANNISGGEKLKISLARTFLKNPDMIILDEPTSALDVNSIEKLEFILKEIKKDKIIIIVTHNRDILDILDEIIDLNVVNSLNCEA
ncbi:ABC transporter ATP-binding protein [Sporanaerobacter acetigenes]|uniref:ATP-binding cassette, subfamily C n=1 Tax=Sporanaerobacter acetigenes DSM 13106 TaxID=1123281 RepID=A0A1M5YKA1_9FIRM|nr:ABC transporter ATP-binding protein [Sporanaerobacter acetigenes]SHI11963.1 ATP-binding cassette, subfamily C [Sporanaerobacter acetigenes DSM 13106]